MIRKDLDVGSNLLIKADEIRDFAQKWQPLLAIVNDLDSPIVDDVFTKQVIVFLEGMIQDFRDLENQKIILPPSDPNSK